MEKQKLNCFGASCLEREHAPLYLMQGRRSWLGNMPLLPNRSHALHMVPVCHHVDVFFLFCKYINIHLYWRYHMHDFGCGSNQVPCRPNGCCINSMWKDFYHSATVYGMLCYDGIEVAMCLNMYCGKQALYTFVLPPNCECLQG